MKKMTHRLKLNTEYFDDVLTGKKNFEVRINDRDYRVGDELILWEWDPNAEPAYVYIEGQKKPKRVWPVNREVHRVITYILPGGAYGLKPNYVVLGMEPVNHSSPSVLLANALSRCNIGPQEVGHFDDKSGSWVDLKVNDHRLVFSFDYDGKTCDQIAVFSGKKNPADPKLIWREKLNRTNTNQCATDGTNAGPYTA